ncbi:uncharacterized protein N7518_001299 [Penicillium psychrosexuale]|uniref:uncharacterized protein n=1 Tax=Penicillium psychrosexuale TaxID=1002107 RepID=UPI0025450AB5|nr:uncharacterized protein N7518_001299 [Penicillium psychrosexuale]KAJ5799231.1 hypothetical protein N7518_001299 [Penicillium psychrosexuale]
MTSKEVCHLFGVSNGVLGNRRNGITLAENIELLFDRGTIAIVPMPGPMKSPTQWRCVVLDESKKEDTIGFFDGSYMRLKDIDNKPLMFVSDNRPRERYLYFCFIIAYLNAKSRGASELWQERLKPHPVVFPDRNSQNPLFTWNNSPDRKKTREEAGQPNPKDKTFDSGDTSTRDADAGTVLGADVCDAILAMKNL